MQTFFTRAGLPLVVVSSLALAGARGQEPPRPGPEPGSARDPLGAHRLAGQPGEVIPRFTMRDLDGNERTLEQQLRRNRVVVLEWIAPTTDAWRQLHEPGGALRELRARHGDQVAWLAICPFNVEDPGAREPVAPGDRPPISAPGSGQQESFWGADDGQRPSWDRGRGGQGATWPWFEQPPPVRFEGPTASMTREEVLPVCREAAAVLGPDVPVLLDASGAFSGRMGVARSPHLVVVGRDGRLVRSISLARAGELSAVLERLTGSPDRAPASTREGGSR